MKWLERTLFAAGACILATALAVAESPDTQDEGGKVDPLAMEIAQESAAFLVGQKSMSFDWFASFDEVVEGREIITSVRSGSNILIRDVGFLSRTERRDSYRDYYYDGKTFTVAAPGEGFYASVEFDRGFEELLVAARERGGLELPLWTLMSTTLAANATENVEAAAYLGTTLIAGQEAHHLAIIEYDQDWQIWISTDPENPVPLMIVGTDPYQQGWPQYRTYLMNWEFDVDPPEGGFV